ncbi:hypothetical protein HUW86_04365 [Fusobacterium sp. SB021]|uniref:alginate O-acetyltransferase AlgX-related protein n=1 Tax=Fusobacterium sp. SB021 TaxID=2744227 RepID=UPI003CF810A7
MGKICFPKEYSKIYNLTYDENFIYTSSKNIEEADIVTIGDSFSQQSKGYQYFLSKNKNILNIKRYKNFEPEQTAIILLNSGYFEKVKPKYIILESIERAFIQRNINLDFNLTFSQKEILRFYEKRKIAKENNPKFINIGNFKFLLNSILYKFDDNAYISPVYIADIDKELFSYSNKKLYFYEEDLKNMKYTTDANLKLVNKNLNLLYKKFQEKGIELIILVPPNKYTLYYEFIKNKKYPASNFFETFLTYNKKYIFINSKEILLKELRNGEKDIYLLNDTHWGIKASKSISNEIIKTF